MFKKFINNKFDVLITSVILITIVLILAFIGLNAFAKPHVRFVTLDGAQQSAEIVNQKLKINFSNAMNKDNTQDNVSITPDVKFTAAWSNNVLYIIFKESLENDTSYTLTISKNLKDLYNDNLNSDFKYEFKTKPAKIAYITKNYENDDSSVVINNANLDSPQTLYSAKGITQFGMNDNYLAVVIEQDKTDDLRIINLQTQAVLDFNFKNIIIEKLDFSSAKNEIAFIKQSVVSDNGYQIPQQDITVNVYDIDARTTRTVNTNNTALGVIDLRYSPDGVNLLYKTSDSYFYLTPVDNFDNYTLIGRYLADGDFNVSGDKILFMNFDPLQTYSKSQYITEVFADRTTKDLTDGIIPVLDPVFSGQSDNVIYAEKYKDLEGTKGIYKIVQQDFNGNKTELYRDDENSLELPEASYDGHFVAIEKYSIQDLEDLENQRNFSFQTKPSISTIVIYDTKGKTLIDKGILGINAEWLR